MTYILKLAPDVERALEQTARRRGVTPDEYLQEVVAHAVQREESPSPDASREERRARRLEALAAVVQTGREVAAAPGASRAPLSDFALSRAGAYDAGDYGAGAYDAGDYGAE